MHRNMKLKLTIFILSIFAILSKTSSAQFNLNNLTNTATNATTKKLNYGTALTNFFGFINPSSFNDNWKNSKTTWLSNVAKAKDVATYSKLLGDMVGNLKSSAFKPSWANEKTGWSNKLKSAKTITDLIGLTSKLENNLNPSAYTKSFASQKPLFDNALRMIK